MTKKESKKLSVQDIAELSGVSPSTVSRVLNDYPHVSDEKRERVLAIIDKYQFKPNMLARAFAKQSTRIIGIVVPELVNEVFADPFFANMIQSITASANELDYDITLWLTAQADDNRVYQRIINDNLNDGLIIVETSINQLILDMLDESGKTYVVIGRPAQHVGRYNSVDVENREGAAMMTRHLIERGHQRIGIIPGRDKIPSAQDRLDGYLDTVRAYSLPVIVGPSGLFSESGAYKSMVYLLQQDVDAVFCASDLMAMGAMRAIDDAGLNIPDDIAVGGFDDMPGMVNVSPPLTTIRQPINLMGQAAVHGLIGVLQGEVKAPFREVFPAELIVREST